MILLFTLLTCVICSVTSIESSTSVWTWKCDTHPELGGRCARKLVTPGLDPVSLATCRLTCGSAATLVPRPKEAVLGKTVLHFFPSDLSHSPTTCKDHICTMLSDAFDIFKHTLNMYHPKFGKEVPFKGFQENKPLPNGKNTVNVRLMVSGMVDYPTLSVNESYSLEISTTGEKTNVMISAPSFFGARHALETLSQLIDYDADTGSLIMLSSAFIKDSPAFPHRGILIDTARNFFSVQTIKRIIDAMSYNKLNVLHWHITETQSFPLKLKSVPKMSLYGAYSPEEVYTAQDVKEVVQYARMRGVRILPELDAPAHVGHGWQWGEEEGLGKLVVCLDWQPWTTYCAGPPCGQMNLANQNLYTVLEKIYKEFTDMFSPIEMFHYGGDEINLNCWNDTTEITEWMTKNGHGLNEEDFFQEWSKFQEKARQLLIKANAGKEVPGILWTSTLTSAKDVSHYLHKDKYIIQIWTTGEDTQIKDLLEAGYRVIFSNYDKTYLDCGPGSWVANGNNWCSPYKSWQELYDNDISVIAQNLTGSQKYQSQILGGEAAAWSEQIDESTIDAKLWPRGAAHAERLWTNPSTNYSVAENRIVHHRQRLTQRGIRADRLQPEWCRQNGGECRLPWKPPQEEEKETPLTLGESLSERRGPEYTISTSSAFLKRASELNIVYIIVFNVMVTFLC